jgi:hypothetical protein
MKPPFELIIDKKLTSYSQRNKNNLSVKRLALFILFSNINYNIEQLYHFPGVQVPKMTSLKKELKVTPIIWLCYTIY